MHGTGFNHHVRRARAVLVTNYLLFTIFFQLMQFIRAVYRHQ